MTAWVCAECLLKLMKNGRVFRSRRRQGIAHARQSGRRQFLSLLEKGRDDNKAAVSGGWSTGKMFD
jgi:hypothetical protein